MLTAGQRDWLRVRSYLQEHRHELALDAAEDFPADRRIAGTALLGAPGWQPKEPVPLQDIALDFTRPDPASPASPADPVSPHPVSLHPVSLHPVSLHPASASSASASSASASSASASPASASPASASPASPGIASAVLPDRSDGGRYLRYSDAIRDLAAPAVFENRSTYRLTRVELTGRAPRLGFTRGRYFDGIDTGEAAAHEYAAGRLEHPAGRLEHPAGRPEHPAGRPGPDGRPAGLRGAIGDPCDLRRRPANLAISTLTLRLDRAAGRASFLLHWRDPAKVGHAGGLYQVIPVGVFQPSGEAGWNEQPDFSLWRSMIREFAEELRGRSEDYDSETRPVDYDSWPFARRMTEALDRGQIRVWCLGLGVDPLTYATDLLTVAVIDSAVFDELFSLQPRRNEEGRVLAARDFAAPVIDRLVTRDPVQAAGAAVLRLAWAHRETLTG